MRKQCQVQKERWGGSIQDRSKRLCQGKNLSNGQEYLGQSKKFDVARTEQKWMRCKESMGSVYLVHIPGNLSALLIRKKTASKPWGLVPTPSFSTQQLCGRAQVTSRENLNIFKWKMKSPTQPSRHAWMCSWADISKVPAGAPKYASCCCLPVCVLIMNHKLRLQAVPGR